MIDENGLDLTEVEVPVNEEYEDQLTAISKNKHKNERLSWKRKFDKMQLIIAEIQPIEAAILKLSLEKDKVVNQITELRHQMVKECIHPRDHLIHMGSYISCKFCNVNLSLPKPEEHGT